MGQILSLPMILLGVFLIWRARRIAVSAQPIARGYRRLRLKQAGWRIPFAAWIAQPVHMRHNEGLRTCLDPLHLNGTRHRLVAPAIRTKLTVHEPSDTL